MRDLKEENGEKRGEVMVLLRFLKLKEQSRFCLSNNLPENVFVVANRIRPRPYTCYCASMSATELYSQPYQNLFEWDFCLL